MSEAASGTDEALALLETLFATAPLGLAFWDAELRYRRINGVLARMNGLEPEEHLGRRLEEVLPELGAQLAGLLRGILETGEPVVDMEVSGETPAAPGVERHWLATYYPVNDAEGSRLGVGAVVREVTAERRADTERLRLITEALTARAQAEAEQVRSEAARLESDLARAEAETVRRQTEFLARAGARMTASMDYEKTLQGVARAAVPVVADWCGVTMLRPDGELESVAAAHSDPELEKLAWRLAERYPTPADAPNGPAHVIRTGEVEHTAEITEEMLAAGAVDAEHLELLRSLQMRSALVVPLKTPDRTLGALTLVFSESDRTFTRDVVALALALATRAALAVENARLYSERSHIARTLQNSLLPARLPDVPGMDVAARYRPSGEQNEVGGDFYDLFSADPGVWTALIGDVAGKGPEAAAVTSLTRHTLWTAALRDASPVHNLQLLNEALLAHSYDEWRFCTVIYARVRPLAGGAEVVLANGGHLPPAILRADGHSELVSGGGTLVGAVADPEFEEVTVHLAPGDLLLLYTDGVTEVSTTDVALGERLLREALEASAGCSSAEVVEAVERVAVEAQRGEPRDDIALLAIRAVA